LTAAATNRQIGPIGTMARVVGGSVAIAVPIALSGVTWWDLGAALVALPLTAVLVTAGLTAAYERRGTARRRPELEPWIRSLVALVLVLAVEIALTFATDLDGSVSFWIFIGLSLFIAALRGDAACEAVAIPNAIHGRRDSTGCVIYTPLDWAEARR
jgi:hypothetical protein